MSANSDSENNAKLSGTDLKKVSDMMDALAFQTLISGLTAVQNTTITTKWELFHDLMQTVNSGNVLGKKGTFYSRGVTGSE